MKYLVCLSPRSPETSCNSIEFELKSYGPMNRVAPLCWVLFSRMGIGEITQKLNDCFQDTVGSIFVCSFEEWRGRGLDNDLIERLKN